MSAALSPDRALQYRQSMGMVWFVSCAYHEHIDPQHRNWERVPTAAGRRSAYSNSRPWHATWLAEVPLMDDGALNRNKIGLTAADVKRMARELLELPALQAANTPLPAPAKTRRPRSIKGLTPLIRRGASLETIYKELRLKRGDNPELDREIARQHRKAEVGMTALAATVRMLQQQGDWSVFQEGRTTCLHFLSLSLKLTPDIKPERLVPLPAQLTALREVLECLNVEGAGTGMDLKLRVLPNSPHIWWHEGEAGKLERSHCEAFVQQHRDAFECNMYGCGYSKLSFEELCDTFCRFALTLQLPLGFFDHRQGPAYYRYPTYYIYFKLPNKRSIRFNLHHLLNYTDKTEPLLELMRLLEGFGNLRISC